MARRPPSKVVLLFRASTYCGSDLFLKLFLGALDYRT